MKNDKTFKDFKKFLSEKCFDEREYGDGKYDRKIWNWFEVGKPLKVDFFKKKVQLK